MVDVGGKTLKKKKALFLEVLQSLFHAVPCLFLFNSE